MYRKRQPSAYCKKMRKSAIPLCLRKKWKVPFRSKFYCKTYVFFICDGCGTKFHGRYCSKCGLEAKDYNKYFYG